jgi:hydrogenase maturation protease
MLVIGYGNTLCGDDGAGVYVAQMLIESGLPETVRVITAYQLLPEMAADIEQAAHVIFVDARIGNQPGDIAHEVLSPSVRMESPGHHLHPSRLMGLAQTLYGRSPSAQLFTITGQTFDPGEGLSAVVRAKLPELVAQVRAACLRRCE